MATKRDKRSGLAEPEVEGVDALFEAPTSTVPEEPQEDTTPRPSSSKKRQAAITAAEEEPEEKRPTICFTCSNSRPARARAVTFPLGSFWILPFVT
jgi:hypothetical protein